jgi:hypothetical protein
MRSIQGWLLLVVGGMAFWLGWELRSYPSAWALYSLGVLAIIFGISYMTKR